MKPVVVKVGGFLAAEAESLATFWASVKELRESNPVVVVHGAGPQATDLARRLGHEPRIVHGRRVTTDLDLDIIKWTLCGGVNTDLVASGQRYGVSCLGLTGASDGTVLVRRRPPWDVDGEMVDFGWVGDVLEVRPDLIERIVREGSLPIVAALGIDEHGQVYNVNADTVAAGFASALGAEALFLVTDSGGLWRQGGADRVANCNESTYEAGVSEGWITGGMRVKLHVAFEALRDGVGAVFIAGPEGLVDRSAGTHVVLGGGQA